MRPWIPLAAMVFGGCISEPSCNVNFDPCPGYGSPGFLVTSSCDCPLNRDIGPQLEGAACSNEGLICSDSEGGFFAENSCRCENGHWRCVPPDMAIPRDHAVPPDLSEDLASEDLASEDLSPDD
jgi:hypothetical protein